MMFENLDKSTLFLNFSKEEINDVLKNIGYYTKSFIKEEFIAFRGDSINCFMILLEGELIAEMQKLNGKVIKIENLLPFNDIAPAFVFGKDNTFPVDLYAIKNSKILYIPKDDFLAILQKNKKILNNILNSFSNRTQFISKKLWFSNKTIEEKLITHILENLDNNSVWRVKKSITDLANIFGVSRPSLSRVIGEFIDEGLLERVDKDAFKVINKESLLEKV